MNLIKQSVLKTENKVVGNGKFGRVVGAVKLSTNVPSRNACKVTFPVAISNRNAPEVTGDVKKMSNGVHAPAQPLWLFAAPENGINVLSTYKPANVTPKPAS